ncbi:trypsin beta [Camponotus floridanus]|uniref:trypsin beta n=1 Tax=Camponotus floridanus TaxID=104421 RepID=UPI000DC6AE44|nr:trypsin beta [Camponotus floridanus]
MNTCFLMLSFFCFIMHSHKVSSNSIERIIGGVDATIQSAPYQLQMRIINNDNQYICSASIINIHLAVTAAHCIMAVKDPLKEIIIKSGCSFLYDKCNVHNIISFVIHENYNSIINDYDIAVIEVSPIFTYNHFTKAVDLALDKNVYTERGKVCGWGYYLKNNYDDDINPVLANTLQCIQIPKISKRQCSEYYKYRFTITRRMLCYGFQNGQKDSCNGDSGAGLVNEDNVLLGITSWGDGCGEINSPGVYTDAIFLAPWINNIIKITKDALLCHYMNIILDYNMYHPSSR